MCQALYQALCSERSQLRGRPECTYCHLLFTDKEIEAGKTALLWSQWHSGGSTRMGGRSIPTPKPRPSSHPLPASCPSLQQGAFWATMSFGEFMITEYPGWHLDLALAKSPWQMPHQHKSCAIRHRLLQHPCWKSVTLNSLPNRTATCVQAGPSPRKWQKPPC